MPMGAYVERGGGLLLGGYFWEGKQVFFGGLGLIIESLQYVLYMVKGGSFKE